MSVDAEAIPWRHKYPRGIPINLRRQRPTTAKREIKLTAGAPENDIIWRSDAAAARRHVPTHASCVKMKYAVI